MGFSLERYGFHKENEILEKIGINRDEWLKEVKLFINSIGDDNYQDTILHSLENIFCNLTKRNDIPWPKIIPGIDCTLKRDERLEIQTRLYDISKHFSISAPNPNRPDYYKIEPLYNILYSNSYFRKDYNTIEYAFSYIFEHQLTDLEKIFLREYYRVYSNYHKLYKKQFKSFPSTDARSDRIKIELLKPKEKRKFEKLMGELDNIVENLAFSNRLERAGGTEGNLYNILLDHSLRDIVFYQAVMIYEESTNNSTTYTDMIRNCLGDPSQEIIERELNKYRNHLKEQIFTDKNSSFQYYSKYRHVKGSSVRNTLPTQKQKIFAAMYLLQKDRAPRAKKQSSSPSPELEDLVIEAQNKVSEARSRILKYTEYDLMLKEALDAYDYYKRYVFNYSPLQKSLSTKVIAHAMRCLGKCLYSYFSKNSDFRWYDVNNIFLEPWIFILTASNILATRIIPASNHQDLMPAEDYIHEYIKYCRELNDIRLLNTKIFALEESAYFRAYLEHPQWVEEFKIQLPILQHVSSVAAAEYADISDNAFQHTDKDLAVLLDLLKKYQFELPGRLSDTTDEMIADFMKMYYPRK